MDSLQDKIRVIEAPVQTQGDELKTKIAEDVQNEKTEPLKLDAAAQQKLALKEKKVYEDLVLYMQKQSL